jgi:hypothetical protein
MKSDWKGHRTFVTYWVVVTALANNVCVFVGAVTVTWLVILPKRTVTTGGVLSRQSKYNT